MTGPTYIDLPTAAQRSNKSAGHLARRCREEWAARGLARLQSDGVRGGKPEWFVSEEADPAFVRIKPPEMIGLDLNHLTEKKRAEVYRRLDVLDRWKQALAGRWELGFSEAQITAQFIATVEARDGQPLSRATLYGWRARYRQGGAAALADARGLSNVKSEILNPLTTDPFLDLVKRLWLHVNKPSLKSCYVTACYEASRSGWPTPPSYGSVHRFVQRIPRPVVDKYRNGEKAFTDKSAVFVQRDYSALHTNESWCGDHHQFDVICQHEGELLRPWLTAWMDERSRKLIGWRIFAHSPNSDTILLALKDGMAEHGVPREVYVDNGKDYDCFALNGRTKADRWRKTTVRLDYDAPYLSGLLATLGIEVTHCQPYHGQSKLIERWFNTLESQFGKLWPTYCGRSPQEKPENLQLNLERGKAPTLAAFTDAFTAYLATYHANADHQGDGMDGRSPDEVFAAEWRDHPKRVASADLMWWLTLKPQHPTKVTQLGVRCNGLHYGSIEPRLFEYRGREVLVRHDPARVNEVFVCDLQGKPICVATANRRLPANASAQELREAMADLRHDRKRVKEYLTTRPALAIDPVDRVISARAAANARAAQAKGPQPDPEPPTLQPVRTAFESEVAAIRKQQIQPLRLAVGAESLSRAEPEQGARFQYPTQPRRRDEGEDDEDSIAPTGGSFGYARPSTEEDS